MNRGGSRDSIGRLGGLSEHHETHTHTQTAADFVQEGRRDGRDGWIGIGRSVGSTKDDRGLSSGKQGKGTERSVQQTTALRSPVRLYPTSDHSESNPYPASAATPILASRSARTQCTPSRLKLGQ